MSRIGLKPIEIPEGVEVKIGDRNSVTVKGPKGELSRDLPQDMKINMEDNVITIERPSDHKDHRALHGTTRSLINNMVVGVSKGFEKSLEIIGVGYRAQKQGNKVVINAGYSHPVEIDPIEGIEIEIPKNTQVVVKGIDKELVGAIASNIRAIRPPEPYKGKGIRYEGEFVRRKEGKTAK
ncbi:50S ribosomal protein L6 [Virgibacillus halodenitrificans]|jgi:large subunit ribosomal protein L6|uniref:Large ribosomal subunit protein uL6 n=1 Tax=Virgibacillus halodenitrificans TaxID=1482 RepID=A0AAC9NJS4_VIRHA|nr:50S ribosomal protein L6 [Virgibacillus halodenitrificans]APC46826.1 50S ribosomal protein L6 [Virgibacillus halodenitrificans]MBD1224004.1 50S ribosomal protein L6 [Virgibacillus halodenitrificans]MCG1029572.1 50S ribosomal protein L6 [Virgibacillus halodenitrificans]MCJ0933071.1 50S ribosomal protein L6 [Virgibacillus halodenitrificans]MEC2158161.1 50S ribosomal protein L6 [Virgibacillus halodenitrificans]